MKVSADYTISSTISAVFAALHTLKKNWQLEEQFVMSSRNYTFKSPKKPFLDANFSSLSMDVNSPDPSMVSPHHIESKRCQVVEK